MSTYGSSNIVQSGLFDIESYLAGMDGTESGYHFSEPGKNGGQNGAIVYNLAVNRKTGRCFAGCHGGHVYTGKDIDELLKNMASSLFRDYRPDTYAFVHDVGEEYGFIVKPGDVSVKTRHGKKMIKHVQPVDGNLADIFGNEVRQAIRKIYEENIDRNLWLHNAYGKSPITSPVSPKRNFGVNRGRTLRALRNCKPKISDEDDRGYSTPFGSRFFIKNQEKERRRTDLSESHGDD